ncbi:MAG: hypothetical protein UW64_C0023G0034 [Microgenomates group bacterium GW2011_GWC1_44_37]|uniref:Uncharacterized protein n=1 Tax=Candidatus Collierbacteria bacterium GW2011_GWB2_44_22 TaxID=1618387 RepID=A0A0G1K624_9BACT|nr:MAG: hypothetical protein UW31_C0016G0002 [Candidatus Collierbacteria bacterium GW2011_GWA2_44_13]KKT51782.1 MAG: hypothetical protein UW44_C0008G0104 [Candidatus Collierbacteria bacterium GW2011_GWB2_44_22]KKT65462.1 MAG: hypothetical protein UW58_C0029G0002 [Candidatus Collierbacteria bacterium GW2011_GWC2_44_30]KKT68318.1 MAG: hypothetical protein UW64_C0023G0034 [Microgenomates group bacterium GW2011_GWC1_44_37]KKT88006.1 MAG: hypothetical protein UW88_C0017G0027 [Candidatus Collierbacte
MRTKQSNRTFITLLVFATVGFFGLLDSAIKSPSLLTITLALIMVCFIVRVIYNYVKVK